jgi:hypothetical protein
LSYSGIDEIAASHLTKTEKCQKVDLIRQSHLINLAVPEIGLCSYCDGVPLKFKKKNGLQFTSTDYLSLLLTPLRIHWTIPLTVSISGDKSTV